MDNSCICQVCKNPGVDMFDICGVCLWQNDISLETINGRSVLVGYVLTEAQKSFWSTTNGNTPANYLSRIK